MHYRHPACDGVLGVLVTRKLNILQSRLRNFCSSLKYDLVCVNMINSATCECSFEIKNVQHFLLDCPLYNIQRTTFLREISPLEILI